MGETATGVRTDRVLCVFSEEPAHQSFVALLLLLLKRPHAVCLYVAPFVCYPRVSPPCLGPIITALIFNLDYCAQASDVRCLYLIV